MREPQPQIIEVIPQSWYDHIRQDVDEKTKREGVLKGMLAWKNWEQETKKLYEKCYNELISIGENASAEKISELVIDVDNELAEVDKLQLEILAIDADLSVVIPEQKELYKEYSKKLKNIEYK